jgi:Phage portal protein, lambda family
MNLFQRLKFALFFNRYDATQPSQFRSWRPATLQDSKLDLTKASREVLQAKSRDYERNSPLYTKIADTIEQYTVGTGIQLTSQSSDSIWNIAADQVWERWKPIADLQSRFGFDNLQGIIARSLFVDGECFILLTRDGAYPRIQLIESHRCKTPDSLSSSEGKTIIDGVKVDGNGRPIGYYFATGDSFRLEDANNVVHVFEPGRPGQYRGIPYCTAALNVLHDLEDLRTLEMRANKDAAELSTIIKTASGEMPSAMVSMAQRFRSTSTAAGTASSAVDSRREYYQSTVGGRSIVLQNGDDAQQFRPERPGANTREYWRLLAADVCACAGTPLSIIFPDSQQGTVYRGSLDAFAAFCRGKTAMLSGYFRRVRNYVIQVEASYNREIAKLPDDWRKTSSGTVRAPNVDIGRNSSAMISELAAGLRTWTSIASELGLDGKQLLKEKAEELVFIQKLAQERGLLPEQIASAQLPQPENKSQESEDISA